MLYAIKPDATGYDIISVEPKSQLDRAVRSAVKAASGEFVIKMFVGSDGMKSISTKDAFDAELATNLRIIDSFGKDAVGRLTTVRGLAIAGIEDVYGIMIEGDEAMFFTLSDRCSESLDTYKFESYASVCDMVTQTLEGFEHLARSGMLHADVKEGNIVACSQQKKKKQKQKQKKGGVVSFKLIDWGMTATFDEIRVMYANTQNPRNCASPMAWYAWGISEEHPDSVAAYTIHKIMHAKIVRRASVFTNPEFRKLTDGAFESFTSKMRRLYSKNNGIDVAVRRAVIRDYVASFDLYNFGLVIASTALSVQSLTVDQRQILMDLAVRLTHYNHPEFVGNDASEAAAMFSAIK